MEFATLRRMRINGRLALPPGRKPIVLIDDVYSNCQKYIQRREQRDDLRIATQRCFVSHELDAAAQQMIRSAATFFVASGHPERGADASHRGGRPGFVEVLDANHLRWPDYRGNLMYQTLGNLMVDDRIGLAFIDFDRGGACFVRGYAKVVFAADDGAERIRSVDVSVTRVWTCRRRRVSVKTVGRRVMRGQTSARDRPAG
jgi:uncharacterized protein